MIYICEKWISRHRKYRVYFELQLIDGKKCEAGGLTAIGLPFSIPIYMGKRPGPTVPVCGAYAIRPYPDDRLFSSKWVGRNSIRPIRRPWQGDECGFWVMSMGDLLGASGPCRARLWGVCNTPLPCWSIVFIQMGRAQQHTPHQTSPTRGRMRVSGYFAGQFIGGIRALPCLIVGRMQYAPTLTVDCFHPNG